MPYCAKCGREMGEADHFCANCGTPAPQGGGTDRFQAQDYAPGLPPAGRLHPALPLVVAGAAVAAAAVLLAFAARGQMAENIRAEQSGAPLQAEGEASSQGESALFGPD